MTASMYYSRLVSRFEMLDELISQASASELVDFLRIASVMRSEILIGMDMFPDYPVPESLMQYI